VWLRSGPPLGSLQRSPDPLAGWGRGRDGRGRGEGGRGKGKGRGEE